MKSTLLATLLVASNILLAQKGQKISINNSLVAVGVEVNQVTSTLMSEGDNKYYTLRKDSYGFGVQLGDGSGFSAGVNVEFHLNKNSRKLYFSTGLQYAEHGGSVFISQGNDPNYFFNNWAMRMSDKVGNLKISSLRVPLSLNFNALTIGKRKNAAIGLGYGVHGFYNFSARVVPYDGTLGTSISKEEDASDAVQKFYYTMFVEIKAKYGRFYAQYNISVLNPTNIWTEAYGTETDTKESFQHLGIGFYLKK